MPHRSAAAALLAFLLLLGSCSAQPLFLFYLDTYSAELEPALAARRRPMAAALQPEFRTAAVVRPLTTAAEKDLRSLLAVRRPAVVYVSPLFGVDARGLLTDFPGVVFVGARQAGAGPGWIAAEPDFGKSLRAAGRLAAGLAEGLGGSEGSTRVGILAVGSAYRLGERIAVFREGYVDGGGPGSPLYRQLDSPNDRVRARQLLEEMRQEGAGLFLLLTYSLTGFCLEYLQKQGGRAIAQGPQAAAAFPEAVLLYFEEDTSELLRAVRDFARRGLLSARDTVPAVVSSPVRLRPGPALQALPAEVLARLAELAELDTPTGPEGPQRP